MERSISYKEDDINSTMAYLVNMIMEMEEQIDMMEEQAIGLRDNLDWKSSAANLRSPLERIKGITQGFGIVDIEPNHTLAVRDLCFSPDHVEKIKERFSKIDTEII